MHEASRSQARCHSVENSSAFSGGLENAIALRSIAA
jgi:hypothetical protein